MDLRLFGLLPLLLSCLLLWAEVGNDDPLSFLANSYAELQESGSTQDAGPYTKEIKAVEACPQKQPGYTVNFDDIPVIQLVRFISQISNRNFVFNSKDLQFPITIVSEDPTSVDDLMAALLQVLRMNGLSVVEQGNNVLIYKNESLSKLSTVVSDDNIEEACEAAIVTRVFRLYNLEAEQVSKIVRPLLSKDAIVETSGETRHLVVTDITANVDKVAELLNALDTPNVSLDVAQYKVQYAVPSALVNYALEILAPLSQTNPIQLIAQSSSKKIFIVSTPFLIDKAMQVLESLDSPEISDVIVDLPATAMGNNNFEVYKLKFHDGREIAKAIKAIGTNLQFGGVANVDLVNTIYSIQWIEINNSLVISGTRESINKVIALIEDLDKAPKQVYIEVLIIDTTIRHSLDFGVEWIALGNEQNKLAYAAGLLNTPPSSAPVSGLTGISQAPLYGGARTAQNTPPPDASRGGAPGTGGDVPLTSRFGFGIIGNIIRHNGQSILTLGSLVNALESDLDTTIVLNPRIMTEDTKQANFFVGQNIPYQTTSTVIRDTGSVTENIQYEDVGVQLRVTPQIAPNNIVSLDIDQAVSEVTSSSAQISSVNGDTFLLAPTTSKNLTTTRVHVPDGCFLVMSGHIRDRKEVSRQGIPCLGTLPWVGPAFSSNVETREKRNLIIFIRPHVVSNVAEGIALTDKEGYDFNWESSVDSIFNCDIQQAPEEACNAP